MTQTAAELLFRPRSIVVYGASSDPDKLSGRPLAYLKKFRYDGLLHAVNPRRAEVQGVRAYDDVASVPGSLDLAVIVVPAESVREAVERCAAAGVGAAIIFASGFGEVDAHGRSAQDELTDISRRSGMRLLGPNCLGSFAAPSRAFATFSTAFDDESDRPDSPIGLVTQSGAVGTFTSGMMNRYGLGVRYFANTGNEADITGIELLRWLVDADDVEVLLGHLEGFKDPEALRDLVLAADRRDKPLLLLKAGRTPAGARAIAAHTASEAGDDAEFDEILAEGGAVRLNSMEAMTDAALLFVTGRHARGPRVTILTLSGGAGALATDAAVDAGLVVEPWSSGARDALRPNLPYYGSTANPIDMTGSMINEIGLLRRTIEAAVDNDETDSIMVVMGNADKDADEIVAALRTGYRATDKPFVVTWTGGSGRPQAELLASGIPAYPDPVRAVVALANLTRFSARRPAAHRLTRSSLTVTAIE